MKIARFTAILLAALFCLSSCASLAGEGSEITTGGDTLASPESSTTDDITTEEDPPVTEMFSTMPNASSETLKYFDPTLSHKPTEYDLLSLLLDKRLVGLTGENILEREIPISELVARLGKPHSRGLPVSYCPWLVWYTENGLYIAVHYFPVDDVPEDVIGSQRTFEYSLVWEIWFCKQEDSPQPIPSYLFPFRGESYETDDVTTEYKETEAETQPNPYDYLFDYPQANKPTNAEAASITPRMTYAELVDRLGKPHGTYRKKPFYTRIWYTQEGGYLQVEFESLKTTNPEITSPTIEDVVEYCVVKEVTFLEQLDETTEETTEPIPEPETIPVSEW